VTKTTLTGTGVTHKDFKYDANGSLCGLTTASCPTSGDRYVYDAENRLKLRVYGAASTSYVYDAGGSMVRRTTTGTSGSESIVYVGGLYERDSAGIVMKYYQIGGRTVAMRKGAAEEQYLLADHLGSTTGVLDADGSLIATRKYWPFGMERDVAGDQRLTDKWYTGQRDEDFDGLGLYNYGNRFYSAVIARFVSADPTNDAINRFAYAANNPLKFVDPSGTTINIACGTTNKCENGSDIDQYRNAIISEWIHEKRYPGATWGFLNNMFDFWLKGALAAGWNGQQTADIFGVVFIDVGGWAEAVKDAIGGWGDVSAFLDNNDLFGPNGADIWLGFSQGGAVVFEALKRAHANGRPLPQGAILIEAALQGKHILAKEILARVRVVTWADEDWTPIPGGLHGWISGAFRFRSDDCGGWKQHCSHGPWQHQMISIAHRPPGTISIDDARILAHGASVECRIMPAFSNYVPPWSC
jgi:RHS repeat-associated protein